MDQPQLDRKFYIGGSDVGAILGLSPWRTPLDVFLQKTGQAPAVVPDPFRERLFRRGRLMEPVVVDMMIEEHGVKVTKRSRPDAPNRYVDQEHPFLAAEIDFEWEVTPEIVNHFSGEGGFEVDPALIGTVQNGEVKTVHPFGAKIYGDEGTDEIPVYYAAQAMHGLMVTGRQLTLFPVLVGSDNLLIYWVRRDDETIAGMREREIAFWRENVERMVSPKPLDISDVYKLLKKDRPTSREATPDVAALISTLRVLKDRENRTEEAIKVVQFEIGCFILGADVMQNPGKKDMGKHVVTVAGKPALWIAYQEQNRIDSEMLRTDYPEAAEACSKVSRFYAFNLKRGSS